MSAFRDRLKRWLQGVTPDDKRETAAPTSPPSRDESRSATARAPERESGRSTADAGVDALARLERERLAFASESGVEQAAVAPPPRSPEPGRRREVTVGLDFGTSTTKAVIRWEASRRVKEEIQVATFESAAGPVVLWPTAIGMHGTDLLFGDAAERETSNVVRSFKMCLPCRDGSRAEASACPRCDGHGQIRFAGHAFPVEDLTTLYMAVALRHIVDALRARVGDDLEVYVNVAAPLDQIGSEPHGEVDDADAERTERDRALSILFQRVAYDARWLALNGNPRSRWPLNEALCELDRAKRREMPPQSESPIYLVPEAHAAITSMALRPTTPKGLYASVDVGAGTTDVAFFWLQKDAEERSWYYGVGSTEVGLDDIDRAMSTSLRSRAERSDRARREGFQRESGLASCMDQLRGVFDRIARHVQTVFGRAYRVDMEQSNWISVDGGHYRFTMLLTGGGTTLAELVESLDDLDVWRNQEYSLNVETLDAPHDLGLLLADGTTSRPDRSTSEQVQRLLVVAHGLSHKSPDIPLWATERPGWRRKRRVREWVSHEEIYGT